MDEPLFNFLKYLLTRFKIHDMLDKVFKTKPKTVGVKTEQYLRYVLFDVSVAPTEGRMIYVIMRLPVLAGRFFIL